NASHNPIAHQGRRMDHCAIRETTPSLVMPPCWRRPCPASLVLNPHREVGIDLLPRTPVGDRMASVTESLRPDFAERLRLSGWSIALLIMSLPFSLPLFVTTIVGISLIGVFGLGIPLVLGSVWITRALADTHRRTFAHLLGVEIPRP